MVPETGGVTTNSDARDVAVVLGGTSAHIDLLQKLRARGYRTVLIDYYDNPPAREFSDQHAKESTLDLEAVRKIAVQCNAKLVIATNVDQANVVATKVSEELALPVPLPSQTVALIANKLAMKDRMLEHGLPTARHARLEALAPIVTGALRYPMVVKPADRNGSAGVRRVDNELELQTAVAQARELSRVGDVIIEEFVTGLELSIDCFVSDGYAKVVLVRRKFKMNGIGREAVMQTTGSIAPYPVSEAVLADWEKTLTGLAGAFGIENAPLLVQAIFTGEKLSIIEFSARLSGGTGSATTKIVGGFDTLEASIDSWLQRKVQPRMQPANCFAMTNTLYARAGVFDRIEGLDAALSDKLIERYFPHKTKGMTIGNDMSTSSRVGAYISTAPTIEGVLEKSRTAFDALSVFDADGSEILMRDIYEQFSNADLEFLK